MYEGKNWNEEDFGANKSAFAAAAWRISGDHENSVKTGDLDRRGHIESMRFDPNSLWIKLR
jgi:hypothetical protein